MAVLACEAKVLECQMEDVTLGSRSGNDDVFDHSHDKQDCLVQPVLHGYTKTSAVSCSCNFMIPLLHASYNKSCEV